MLANSFGAFLSFRTLILVGLFLLHLEAVFTSARFFLTANVPYGTLGLALCWDGMHSAAPSKRALTKFSYSSFGVCVSVFSCSESNLFFTLKWFKLLLFNINSSICWQLNVFKYFYFIQFYLILMIIPKKWLNRSIWSIDGTLTGTTTLGYSWPESSEYDRETTLPKHQDWILTIRYSLRTCRDIKSIFCRSVFDFDNSFYKDNLELVFNRRNIIPYNF